MIEKAFHLWWASVKSYLSYGYNQQVRQMLIKWMTANNMKQKENNYGDYCMTNMAPHAFITKLFRNVSYSSVLWKTKH